MLTVLTVIVNVFLFMPLIYQFKEQYLRLTKVEQIERTKNSFVSFTRNSQV